MNISASAIRQTAQREAHAAAARWRLPFSRRAWRGVVGHWAGVGAGSSLDFQDHRNYVPGDDPRHIHWQAFARTGALTMKLYRAELAPVVEVTIDVSESMALLPAKTRRADELLAFCVECADRAAAPVRVQAVCGRRIRAIPVEAVRADRWRERLDPNPADAPGGEAPGRLAWRPGAMKIFISDLLFSGDPGAWIAPLAAGSGVGLILAPALAEEAELPWRGNVELTDCETGRVRRQRVDAGLAHRYRAAYARHFELWREAGRRRGVLLARIPCVGALPQVLAAEAFAAGAVEAAP